MRKSLLLILVAVAMIPMQVGAYGVDTHAALTQEIARFFNQHYPERAFTSAEMKLLMGGAVDEDDGLRMLNHFYDPVHKVGLPGQLASREWVQNPAKQAGMVNNALALVLSQDDYNSGDYTWKRAIEDYARGETKRGLEGLGHVLHLVEDLTVPAHVRNDPHPPKKLFGEDLGDDDPYELWSHKFNAYNINITPFLRDKKPVAGLGSLNKYFDELATYTNAKFFSKDTIDSGGFFSPKITESISEKKGDSEFLSVRDSEGSLVLGRRKIAVFSQDASPVTTDSDIVSQSTWDRLSIKAVQYGAGVVDLFFNEVEKLKKDPKFQPASQKSLLGQFIDSVGENVGALISGAPEPQPVIVTKTAAQPVIVESVEPVEDPVPEVEVVELEPLPAPVTISEPVVVLAEPTKRTLRGSGGGGGNDEPIPEVSAEAAPEPEPVTEPEVVAEPVIESDITPPAGVVNLEVDDIEEGALTLHWTAPGDDENSGTATSYEVRYSTSPITEENWLVATLVPGIAAPQEAGEDEDADITSLDSATTYYFALKAKDEAGNESVLSNVAHGKTLLAAPNYIVISEVFPDMAGADTGEFVELYNPTDVAIDISGYSLQYLSGSAAAFTSVAKKNFVAGAIVPAKGFYLVGMSGNAAADMSWSEQLNNTGATVFLVNDQLAITDGADVNIIDQVAYGTGSGVLSSEGTAASLPGEGKSIERQSFAGGVCGVATGEGEFMGNGCDTGDNASDFEVRAVPKAQRISNLFEPRRAPSTVSNEPMILTYDASAAQLQFVWTASEDAMGDSAGIQYRIMDISDAAHPVQLYSGTALSFTKTIDEVGREYRATIQAVDEDGLASEPTELFISIPSYLSDFDFFEAAPASASGSSEYAIRLAWDSYPFIPIGTNRWHLAVFYYNEDAKKTPFLGQLNTGYNWGAGISMPSVFKTQYANCFGTGFTTKKTSALILPDSAAQCSGIIGGSKSQSIDFGLLRDGVITLPVLPQTFGGTNPTPGESYVTVAFYAFAEGNSLGNDQRLIAVDKTRYYLSE